jgi:hypothetical protein
MSKGPLLSTTLALFGAGSYLDIHHTIAEAYHTGSTNEWGGCIDILPFIKLLRGADDKSISLDIDPYVNGAEAKFRQQTVVADYIGSSPPTSGAKTRSITRAPSAYRMLSPPRRSWLSTCGCKKPTRNRRRE